jgi:spermidine/putrescine-binding protein
MIRRFFQAAVLAACAVAIPAALSPSVRAAEEKVLNLYIWSDYLAPDTIANFTMATGIKVNVDVFDSSETLEAKLLAGKSGYDVVVPNGPILKRFITAGVVRPLDKTKLPHLATQDPAIVGRAAAADPGNAHAFLDYILTPETIGPITNEVWYANANAQAKPFVEKEILDDEAVYPPPAVMEKLFPENTPSQDIERLRTRLWSRVKSGS